MVTSLMLMGKLNVLILTNALTKLMNALPMLNVKTHKFRGLLSLFALSFERGNGQNSGEAFQITI